MFGELELAYRFCECPIVAITGTNGKTTTTELVERVLAAAGKRTLACGNIGTTFSSAVSKSSKLDVLALEVSSFQLEHIIDFRPRISVHLNLTPDHLESLQDDGGVRAGKMADLPQPDGGRLCCGEYEFAPAGLEAKKITINATGVPADYRLVDGWLVAHGEQVLEQSRTNLIGQPQRGEHAGGTGGR